MATQSAKTSPLSPLDQIMPRVYTRIILCIPTSPDADRETVTTLLSRSLRKTAEQIPFLDGEVLPDATRPDRRSRVAMRVSQPHRLQLQTKDLTQRNADNGWAWSYQDLAEAKWPASRFDGDILSPVDVFASLSQDGDGMIMAAQANFIAGGLLLCVGVSHSVMDGIGVGAVIKIWAQNCRELQGEHGAAPAIVITPETLDRIPLMQGGTEKASPREHPEYVISPPSAPAAPAAPPSAPAAPPSLPPMEAKIFHFSADSLSRLKDAAKSGRSAELAPGQDQAGVWISTNDALSALLWSSITRARMGTDGASAVNVEQSKLGMANNGRRKLDPPLPDTYIGNVNLYSLAIVPLATVGSETALPQVARAVRESVNRIDDLHIRSVVQMVDGLEDVTQLMPAFNSFLGWDLAISTWAELGLNGLDWGQAIGRVERVRPPYAQFDGLCIVLPRTVDGGLEVFMGLKVETMERLLRDEYFVRFAQVGQ